MTKTRQTVHFLISLSAVCGSWNLTDAVAAQLVGDTEVADLEAGAQWPSLAVLFNVKRKASCTVTIFSPRWLLTSHTCVSRSLVCSQCAESNQSR